MAKIQDGKNYIIMNVASGTVVDLFAGGSAPGTKITGWQLMVKNDEAQKNQIWTAKLEDTTQGDQWYSFRNVRNGMMIDHDGKPEAGAPIMAFVYAQGNTAQHWSAYPVKRGAVQCYVFYNRGILDAKNGFGMMDLYGGGTANQTPIQLRFDQKPSTNDNQMWMLIEVQ